MQGKWILKLKYFDKSITSFSRVLQKPTVTKQLLLFFRQK